MKQLSDKKNMRLGVVISYVSLVVSLLGALFISNRVLDYIGDYNQGLYSFVTSITTWLTVASGALNASFLRYATAESGSSEDSSKTNTIYLKLLSLISGAILVIGFGILAVLYFGNICLGKYSWEDSRLMYALFAVSILYTALSIPTNLWSLYINFRKKFAFNHCLSLAVTVLTFGANFFIAYYTKNVILLASFNLVSTVIYFVARCIYSKKVLHISFAKCTLKENKALIVSILGFSSVLVFNSIVDQINGSIDKTLLGIFSVPGDVALYQYGQIFCTYLVTMSTAVSSIYAPDIHRLCVAKDREGLNRTYLRVSLFQTVIVCLAVFGFIGCGYEFVSWWIGEKRIAVYYIGAVLMLIDICPLTMNASIEIQRAMDKHRFRAFVYFAVALLNLLLSVLFLLIFPAEKAIAACVLGSVIARICSHWICMNLYNKKAIHLPVGKYMLTVVKYMAAGSACAGVVFLSKSLWKNLFFVSHLAERQSFLLCFLAEGLVFIILYAVFVLLFNRNTVKEWLNRKNA